MSDSAAERASAERVETGEELDGAPLRVDESVRVPAEVRSWAQGIAEQYGVSRATVLRWAIEKGRPEVDKRWPVILK